MSEVRRIHDQLHRAFYGEAWHGPAVKEVLSGLTAEEALQKPVAGGHSVWELVRHIEFWEGVALKRVQGDTESRFAEADGWNFSIDDTSESGWAKTRADFERNHIAFENAVESLTDDQLERQMPGDMTLYVLLHGVIQHDLYHTGQMSLLKRAILGKNKVTR